MLKFIDWITADEEAVDVSFIDEADVAAFEQWKKDNPGKLEAVQERVLAAVRKYGSPKLPTTPEEVAAAEEEIDESAVVLPDALRDPMKILERKGL